MLPANPLPAGLVDCYHRGMGRVTDPHLGIQLLPTTFVCKVARIAPGLAEELEYIRKTRGGGSTQVALEKPAFVLG